VEIEYFLALLDMGIVKREGGGEGKPEKAETARAKLRSIYLDFSKDDALKIKEIEKVGPTPSSLHPSIHPSIHPRCALPSLKSRTAS